MTHQMECFTNHTGFVYVGREGFLDMKSGPLVTSEAPLLMFSHLAAASSLPFGSGAARCFAV